MFFSSQCMTCMSVTSPQALNQTERVCQKYWIFLKKYLLYITCTQKCEKRMIRYNDFRFGLFSGFLLYFWPLFFSFLRRWHHLTPSKVSRQILPKWRWIEKPSERFSSCCHHQRQRGAELESSLHY